MGKVVGILVGVGVTAAVAGGVLFAVAWSQNERIIGEMVTNTTNVEESFENFEINSKVSKINFLKSTDGTNKVVSKEREKLYSKIEVVDNTLKVTQIDDRPWYNRWFFRLPFSEDDLTIDIYLTGETYNNLKAFSNIGSITVNNGFTFNTVDAETNTGSIKITSNVTESIKADCDTGSVTIENVTTKKLDADTATG